MKESSFTSHVENTWCPGCGNFAVQRALRELLTRLDKEGFPIENIVLVAGIGQHGKIFDFMNINGVYALHGRTIPVATGIRLANPDLKVICIAGDGDCYAEGLEHLIFAAKRNLDITVLVHDNRVYGLTTGQFTPTSPAGFQGHSTPRGEQEMPLNPVDLMLSAGATFIGRAYTRRYKQIPYLIHGALMHRGFSFVDVLQICVTYNDMTEYYNGRVYDWNEEDAGDFRAAREKAREWDYNTDARIGLGVMYRHDAPIFEDGYPTSDILMPEQRRAWISKIIDERR